MFCRYCGSQLEDGSKFCSECGSPLVKGAPQNPMPRERGPVPDYRQGPGMPNYMQKNMKPNNKKVFLFGGVAVAAVLLICIIFFVTTRKHTINISDYYLIEYRGADGNGWASVNVNESKLIRDLLHSCNLPGAGSVFISDDEGQAEQALYDYYDKHPEIEDYLDTFDRAVPSISNVKIEPNQDLKNGDKITISLDVNEDECKKLEKYGIVIKSKPVTVTVTGLE